MCPPPPLPLRDRNKGGKSCGLLGTSVTVPKLWFQVSVLLSSQLQKAIVTIATASLTC